MCRTRARLGLSPIGLNSFGHKCVYWINSVTSDTASEERFEITPVTCPRSLCTESTAITRSTSVGDATSAATE